MDTGRFDDLTRALTGASSRRAAGRLLIGGALGSLLAVADAAARKKGKGKNKKKKKPAPKPTPCQTECCADSDCGARNRCIAGRCVTWQGTCATGANSCDELGTHCNGLGRCLCFQSASGETRCGAIPEGIQCGQCSIDTQCTSFGAGAFCVTGSVPDGNCSCGTAGQGFCIIPCDRICRPENGCCVDTDCGVGQICYGSQCVTGQGTCANGANRCGVSAPFPCNENPNCFCYTRVEGGTRCGSFVGACDNCRADIDCAAYGVGAFCLVSGANCCAPSGGNRCALPCPT